MNVCIKYECIKFLCYTMYHYMYVFCYVNVCVCVFVFVLSKTF